MAPSSHTHRRSTWTLQPCEFMANERLTKQSLAIKQFAIHIPYPCCAMANVTPTDFNITLAARSMIRVYGRDAAAEARRRAEADDADSSAWRCILAAIEKLQAEKPEPAETVE